MICVSIALILGRGARFIERSAVRAKLISSEFYFREQHSNSTIISPPPSARSDRSTEEEHRDSRKKRRSDSSESSERRKYDERKERLKLVFPYFCPIFFKITSRKSTRVFLCKYNDKIYASRRRKGAMNK